MEGQRSSEEVVWGVLIEDFDFYGSPVNILNGQLFMNLNNPTPQFESKFFGALGDDIADNCIWPRLMYGDNKIQNFLICTSLRGVCKSWLRYVDGTKDYNEGFDAWIAGEAPVVDVFGPQN